MMNSFVRRILKLGPLMWDLVVSTAGCFAFTRCFRLIAIGKEESDTGSSICVTSRFRKPSAGIGAALLLLAFIASEGLTMIGALGL
jgi:hypothetical protein